MPPWSSTLSLRLTGYASPKLLISLSSRHLLATKRVVSACASTLASLGSCEANFFFYEKETLSQGVSRTLGGLPLSPRSTRMPTSRESMVYPLHSMWLSPFLEDEGRGNEREVKVNWRRYGGGPSTTTRITKDPNQKHSISGSMLTRGSERNEERRGPRGG